jgi:hypothetical protein
MRRASASASPPLSRSPLPGTSGTPADSAMARARCFSPKSRMCRLAGPMKAIPAASHFELKSTFSLRNP